MIKMPHSTWQDIMVILTREYVNEPSVVLIRSKMKSTLGFTQRYHKEWVEKVAKDGRKYGHYREHTVLDFYNESSKSWFLIKFADQLKQGEDTNQLI